MVMERSSLLMSPGIEGTVQPLTQDEPLLEVVSPVSALEPGGQDYESESEFPQRSVGEGYGNTEPLASPEAPLSQDQIEGRVLKTHKTGLFMAISYVALTSTEWILTCVLAATPLVPELRYGPIQPYDTTHSYAATHGGYGEWWTMHERSIVTLRALASISAVLALPTASTILARTSVALARSNNDKSKLSLRQTLAYADRAWMDFVVMARILGRRERFGKQWSPFLGFAWLFCAIGG